jgi:hypothetical protein
MVKDNKILMQLISHHKKTVETGKEQGEQICLNVKFIYYYDLIITN